MNADELALCETFPATLRHEAETLILRQPYRSRLSVLQGEAVVSDGQTIRLIRRQYAAFHAKGDEVRQLMAHCLNTRHHDGHVRERHFKPLLAAGQPAFVLPFAAQLLGEYVFCRYNLTLPYFSNTTLRLWHVFSLTTRFIGKSRKIASAAIGIVITAAVIPIGKVIPSVCWRKKSIRKSPVLFSDDPSHQTSSENPNKEIKHYAKIHLNPRSSRFWKIDFCRTKSRRI